MGVGRGEQAAGGESDAASRPPCQVGWLDVPSPSTQESRLDLDYSPSSPVTWTRAYDSLASWLIEAEMVTLSFRALTTSPPHSTAFHGSPLPSREK